MVDEAVVAGLLGREPAVAIGVGLDGLDGLTAVLGDEGRHALLDVEHLLGLDLDVGRGSAEAARGLVHHDARIGRGVALTRRAGDQEELPHAGGERAVRAA